MSCLFAMELRIFCESIKLDTQAEICSWHMTENCTVDGQLWYYLYQFQVEFVAFLFALTLIVDVPYTLKFIESTLRCILCGITRVFLGAPMRILYMYALENGTISISRLLMTKYVYLKEFVERNHSWGLKCLYNSSTNLEKEKEIQTHTLVFA